MSLILQSKANENFTLHPEGIYSAVCVDVMDLGPVEIEFQGRHKMMKKLRLFFESEQKAEDGRNCVITKTFTASLHPKAKLTDFLSKWRGRPVALGETIDLRRAIGACCTLVISHQQNASGQTYASIDAISRPTKKLMPSGHYDPAVARRDWEAWKARHASRTVAPAPRTTSAAPPTAPSRPGSPPDESAPSAPSPEIGF